MISYISIFVLQVAFNICKALEIRYTYENRLAPILWVGLALSVMMIWGFYLSIGALLKGEWVVVLIYVSGSVLGKYLSFLINKRKKII
jgi:hypothetical protein